MSLDGQTALVAGATSEVDYPAAIVAVNHVEPAPRRVRGFLAGELVFDTTRARYVWEWPYYPQYYVPLDDVRTELLVPEGHTQATRGGQAELHGLRVGDVQRPRAAKVHLESPIDGVGRTARFEWEALDAWFEEDEQVFVHPRSPYVRVDAIRSTRSVRIELDGVVLASSSSPVLVFETGLPTRYYLDRTHVDLDHMIPSETVTACPYKGTTSQYWSIRLGDEVHQDLAWAYDFPTRELLPISGLIAFYNEKVDVFLDGRQLERPVTHFVKSATEDNP
jgi:uncharacterized protein (DUF427 family)